MEKNGFAILLLSLTLLTSTTIAAAMEPTAVVGAVAARLDQAQVKEGVFAGGWDGEWGFNGSIVAGLVDAYEHTGNEAFEASAILGGEFILIEAGSVFMGDEAYALLRLSEITSPPDADRWRNAVATFFDEISSEPNGVFKYADLYLQIDPSTAVFYLAHFAVAAHRVGATCADDWRSVLGRHLARVCDESASYPVMALGVATWAYAKTGELDDTLVGSYDDIPYWDGVRLADLPSLLLSHQVPEVEPFAGTLYWRFDHTSAGLGGPVAGWTEDAVYGLLGLVAAASSQEEPSEDMEEAIAAVHTALLDGPAADGAVHEHLSKQGKVYHAYAGEILQAFWAAQQHQDAVVESQPQEESPLPSE